MLIGMARGIPGGVIGKGNFASKKNLVAFLFGNVYVGSVSLMRCPF